MRGHPDHICPGGLAWAIGCTQDRGNHGSHCCRSLLFATASTSQLGLAPLGNVNGPEDSDSEECWMSEGTHLHAISTGLSARPTSAVYTKEEQPSSRVSGTETASCDLAQGLLPLLPGSWVPLLHIYPCSHLHFKYTWTTAGLPAGRVWPIPGDGGAVKREGQAGFAGTNIVAPVRAQRS